jgi:(R)-2-hydroxyglutarate---pyruvate transhydrogenase
MHVSIDGYDNPELAKEVESLLEPFVYEFVQEYKGSISAEHGIGFLKAPHIFYSKNEDYIQMMV